MAKIGQSARGQTVNFDVLSIKQQLASRPAPVSVSNRRKFIDEKDGIKRREIIIPTPATSEATPEAPLPSALAVAAEAAEISAGAKHHKKKGTE
jgi:hypothetical protein